MYDLVLNPKRGLTDPQEPVPIRPDGTVTIGRAGTLKVHDELVSIHHAQVFFDPASDRYLIRDLDSSSGTIVDGECIRNEIRPIRDGTELRFGNAVIVVQRARRSLWRAAVLGCATILAFVGAVTLLLPTCRNTGEQPIVLPTEIPVWGLEAGPVQAVPVPPTWLRHHGLPWDVRLHEVTDYDSNNVSELWLVVADRLAIVTFGDGGRWVDLGLLPLAGYRQLGESGDRFPILSAGGETWQMDAELGRYRPIAQDGVVVWYREEKVARPAPTDGKGKGKAEAGQHPGEAPAPSGFGLFSAPKPLKVARVPVKDAERLGQFFVDRGIYGKVHYLICEGAFEGIRPQALTTEGDVVAIRPGCIEELRLDANEHSRIRGKPYAIALSPAGRRALVDDVMTYYAGDPSGLFLDDDGARAVEGLRGEPGAENAATRLIAGDGRVVVPSPFPAGTATVAEEPRLLEAMGRLYPPSPPARTLVVEGPGTYEFDLIGLYGPGQDRPERFRVVVSEHLQVTVEEISGKPREVVSLDAASGAQRDGRVDDLVVRVRAELYQWITENRVKRILVGVRPLH